MRLPGVFGAELVFVDGRYARRFRASTTLPRGVAAWAAWPLMRPLVPTGVESHLARVAPFDRRAFVAFNTAFFADGAYIHIPAHTVVEKPIHVLFVSTGEANGRPAMSHPRVLAVLGDDSQASIVESYAGPEGAEYFTNVVTEIVLGQNAVLDHYKLQQRRARRRTTWAQFS